MAHLVTMAHHDNKCYIFDLAATLRSTVMLAKAFGGIELKLLNEIPSNFEKFLNNGENKEQLFELN